MVEVLRRSTSGPVEEAELVAAFEAAWAGRAVAIGQARNSRCFRFEAASGPWVVKLPTEGDRTNPDRSYVPEFAVLEEAWARGLRVGPRPVAVLEGHGEHALVLGYQPGRHLEGRDLKGPVLGALLGACEAMDRLGLGHYDLQPSNVLVDGEAVHLIDFEFARFGQVEAARDGGPAFQDDYNASPNPHLPLRLNATNLEFRAFSRMGPIDLGPWLRLRSAAHRRQADHLGLLEPRSPDEALVLRKAADHERVLSRVLVRPEVVAVEQAVIGFRTALFDRESWWEREIPAWEALLALVEADDDGRAYARGMRGVVARLRAKEAALRAMEAWGA